MIENTNQNIRNVENKYKLIHLHDLKPFGINKTMKTFNQIFISKHFFANQITNFVLFIKEGVSLNRKSLKIISLSSVTKTKKEPIRDKVLKKLNIFLKKKQKVK